MQKALVGRPKRSGSWSALTGLFHFMQCSPGVARGWDGPPLWALKTETIGDLGYSRCTLPNYCAFSPDFSPAGIRSQG